MDPNFDIILSYPSLRTHKLGVLPHQNALVYEADLGKLLLAGAQATGVAPRYDLIPARASKTSATPSTLPAVPKDTDDPSWCTSAYCVTDTIRNSIVDYFARGTPSVDAFANSTNARFRRYCTRQQDAFQQDLSPTPIPSSGSTPHLKKWTTSTTKLLRTALALSLSPQTKSTENGTAGYNS